MEKYNPWNKKVLNAETPLDSSQWGKMQALLDEVDSANPKEKSKKRFFFILLLLGVAASIFGFLYNSNQFSTIQEKNLNTQSNINSIQTVSTEDDQVKNNIPTTKKTLDPINKETTVTKSNRKLQSSINSLETQIHIKPERDYVTTEKNEHKEEVITNQLQETNGHANSINQGLSKINIEFIQKVKPDLVFVSPIREINYFIDWTSDETIPGFKIDSIISITEMEVSNFINSIELQYFHNQPAVFGIKLFLKRDIPITNNFDITLGGGVSWTRGIEGYLNDIFIITDTSTISRQLGYSFQSDARASLEFKYHIKKIRFYAGLDISYTFLNSNRTADSESFFDPNKPFEFRIYQKYNQFDNINRLGYTLTGGVNYQIGESYTLGFGVHKRLNTYFNNPDVLDITKNNIALEYELRLAKYF